jgi:hypothetical protein
MFTSSKNLMPTTVIKDRYFDTPDSYHWRKIFAWFPVRTISGKYVWLKTIYKQKFWASFEGTGWGGNFHLEPAVEYAEFIDIMKMDQSCYI